MLLVTAYKEFYEYLKKGIEDGLNHEDYKKLFSMAYMDFDNDVNTRKWLELKKDIGILLDDLNLDPYLKCDISKECMDYILEHCFLLPLVLANNKHIYDIQPYQEGTFLLPCQFHDDDYTMMEVIDYKNKFKCYECDKSGDVITYLKMIDSICDEKNIIDLLRFVFRLDRIRLDESLYDLSIKYRKAILSDQYKRLLDRGYGLFKSNNVISIDGMGVDKLFEDRFYTIHRIEKGEFDSYFKYEENTNYKLKLVKNDYKDVMEKLENRI